MDYASMSLDELSAACAEHYAAVRAIRARLTPDLDAAKRLVLELEAAEHRAHLNVIQPLRTDAFILAELARGEYAKRLAKLTPEQFEALKQLIVTGPPAAETVVTGPAAEAE